MMQWHKTPGDLQLSPGHIDLWSAHLDLPEEQIKVFAKTLDRDEIARAEKFNFPDKYCEYVVTRGLLRLALALVAKMEPEDFQFDYTEHNKPGLKKNDNPEGIAFNVSHSHDYALVAIGVNRNIGVDVEKVRESLDHEKLAQRFFSTAEYAALMQTPVLQRARVFYTIWTRKEAFVKAIGKGISFGLSEFDVTTDEPALLKTHWDPEAALQWKMATIHMEENYRAALVSDGGEFALRHWTL